MTLHRTMRPARGLVFLALAACAGLPGPEVGRKISPEVVHRAGIDGPPGAEPDSCWGQDVTPAVIETVTKQVVLQPPEIGAGGEVRAGPVYHTETRQQIVKEREMIWFRTPCPEQMTPGFVASLQRALGARGQYHGPVTGEMDTDTRRAVRGFQQPLGLNSGLLSLNAAQQLGISAYDRDDL